MADNPRRETILEFRQKGQFGQIIAVDVETGVEVSVTVPANTSKLDRETLALRKLAKALEAEGIGQKNSGSPEGVPPSSKRGFLA